MKIKIVTLIISIIYLPFSLLLTYKMLELIEASELMWFLYWLIIPMAFIVAILNRLAEWEED